MDLSGGPPVKLQQDVELQDLWVPATPAKITSTRRPLASTHSFGQPSGQSWLDPSVASSTEVLNALPPWELAFQNGSNGSVLGNCVPDRAPAIAEASARRTGDTCFMLNSSSSRCGNMGSICWSPELCGNDLAVRNSATMGEMPPFAPSFAQIAGEKEMNTSTNKCLLNGKVLLEGSSWSVQKGQYKSPATCLNYLNSYQETTNFAGILTVPNSVTPLIMEKYSKRRQDEQQALVVTGSVQEVGIEENSLNEEVSLSKQVFDSPADASFSNLMALAHQRAFYNNPESAKQIAALPCELTDKLEGHDITNERGNEVIELINSSKQKPKRKKHRPKVIIEGKTSRTPKPATPQAKTPKKAQNQESATGKRKYVRRKVAPSFETGRNGLINNVELGSSSGAKSVRRSLNFDLEAAKISEKYCAFMSIQNQVKEYPVQGTFGDDDALNGLRLIKTVDDSGEHGPMVENSLTRFDPDVDSSPSQAVNEFLEQLQHQPQVPTLMGKPEVGSLQSNDYSFYLNHAVPKGTKRDHCVIVDAFASSNKNLLHPYNAGDCASQCQNAGREGRHHLDVHKRMRTENVEYGAASNTVLTYNPQTGWTTINSSHSRQELNFDGAQKLMAQKKIHTANQLIFGEDTYGNGYNLLSQGNNLTSNGFMNFTRSPSLLEPSSNIKSKRSTLSKPSGYSKRKSNGKRGPRGDKKKEENPPVTPVPSSTIDGATPGERNTGVTTTATTHLLGKNLHWGSVPLGSQDTGNCKVSTNLCFSSGSLALCVDDMDDIVQKLKWLSINREHEVTQEQNAIVPYAGNSGEMVLYGGNFDQARRRRPRAKVDLDQETNRVWKLLMGKEGEVDQEANALKEKWWEEERRVFQGRVDSFIARMHLVQGDRRFSQWKGSVVDSVIGVFLTQNVSDHLSSSAFMALAAKFPLQSTGNSTCSNAEKASSGEPYHASSEANATENDSKKESSSSIEMVETATGSSGIDNSNGNIKELHEPEVSFGNESPNSCCGIQVSVTRSVSSAEVEDKRFMEEVVSSHNSVTSSQNSTESQAQSSGYIEPNSVLNVDAQDPLIRSMNDGFGSATFTELLQMAEECRFHKLNDHNNGMFLTMQSSSINCQATHEIGNNSPVLHQPDNSGSTSQHELYSLPDKLLDSRLCHSLFHANSTTMDNNGSMSREEKIRSLLPSNASETSICNKHEVPFRECNELAEENLAESSSLTEVLSDTTTARVIDTYVPVRVQNNPQISSETDIGTGTSLHSFDNSSLAERTDATSNTESSEVCIQAQSMPIIHQKEIHSIIEVESSQYAAQYDNQRENSTNQNSTVALNAKIKNNSDVGIAVIKDENFNVQKISSEAPKQGEKGKRRKGEGEKITYDWENLRKEVSSNKFAKERSSDTVDSLDWEAVRCADVREIAETIRERGMNNMLAERIKGFLNRLVREHGNIDLEWLRDVPPDKSKDFLLSIRGLGLKSAECVRLLTLHHLAFPVDTNVGRICVRLGWVPLQPLPESLQLHLLELYPVLETIQKYLWPRLCKLDQRTLYELHYQMITFGKVFCTKSKPNCNSCPMRGECRHFASAFTSARLALPAPEDKSIVSSTFPIAYATPVPDFSPRPIAQLECGSFSKDSAVPKLCEPIVEEPATPEPECQETLESAIEEAFFQDPDEIPTISLNFEKFTQNLQHYIQQNMELPDGDMSKALVALTPEAASLPMPKLKNVSRLRTEHQVYEIPDSHPLLKGLDQREPDDPCPYLLAIWTPGETAQSTEPPETSCTSQCTGQLCDRSTCFSCNSVRETQGHIVRGTLLIPCRTAMRGSFPLNGTYFQVNEVFADHISSRNPIDVPRDWIWNLPRRTVYFGTSVPTIFRGLTTEAIQQCFWRGFVCVRGFDRATRAPRPLYARLHFPASKAPKNRKVAAAAAAAKVEE